MIWLDLTPDWKWQGLWYLQGQLLHLLASKQGHEDHSLTSNSESIWAAERKIRAASDRGGWGRFQSAAGSPAQAATTLRESRWRRLRHLDLLGVAALLPAQLLEMLRCAPLDSVWRHFQLYHLELSVHHTMARFVYQLYLCRFCPLAPQWQQHERRSQWAHLARTRSSTWGPDRFASASFWLSNQLQPPPWGRPRTGGWSSSAGFGEGSWACC